MTAIGPPVNEAVWALIGVAFGAVIPGITTIYQTHVSARQAESDRQASNDSRLFDLRRDAYVEFQTRARVIVDFLWKPEILKDFPSDAKDGVGDAELLAESEARVQLFGSASAAEAAREVLRAIYIYSTEFSPDRRRKADAALQAFAQAARTDLGARN